MKQIQTFYTGHLRNAEDFAVAKRILAETASLTDEADAAVVNVFKAAVEAFDEVLKYSEASAYTKAVEDADKKVDAAWRGISNTAKAQTGHPTAEVASAAEEVVAIIKKYGDVTGMSYNEEYGNIPNALQDFEALGTAKQKLCYVDAWVADLQTRYDEFIAAQKSRTDEQGAKEDGAVKKARTDCDEKMRVLFNYVNTMVAVKGVAAYSTFIDNSNVIIDEAKAVLASRATRSGKPSSSGGSSSKNDDEEDDSNGGSSSDGGDSSSSGDSSDDNGDSGDSSDSGSDSGDSDSGSDSGDSSDGGSDSGDSGSSSGDDSDVKF